MEVREPLERDLMHFTRYSIDFLHVMKEREITKEARAEQLRERKFWAADVFLSEDPKQKLYVAEVQGRMTGYALGRMDDNNQGTIQEIYVDEFYRREGIGSHLCRAVLAWMDEQDVSDVRVSPPFDLQRSLDGFLRAVGFCPVQTTYSFQKNSR
ncbi:GNAT family N-acetyltransferase [Halobacillus sp. ACCC02827]|uniref:GNAT family N-acetyltransferase n=1 Tax=Halobacillus sp. ACCC02827 TaxID=3052090 RepID=UPI00256FB462|nr:GNAT family N-acetyltransferase [Halobacillus sp. ACCC02827]WJE16126.1 GNAT family N-acetyltransferase [Halobacillus sp. ACCC02827]